MNTQHASAFVNGDRVSVIDITDRGLQYGDGVFETLRVHHGKPVWWAPHMERLLDGCHRLQISRLPDIEILRQEADSLLVDYPAGTLKIIITRGNSSSGYGAPADIMPNRVLIAKSGLRHQAKSGQGIVLGVCRQRLSGSQQLSGIKHLNRLEQVLARLECQEQSWDEGVMLDDNERVIEGSMSNLFAWQQGRLLTPRLEQTGINGICRQRIMSLAEKNEIKVEQCELDLDDLQDSDGLFVTNSLIGVWPVIRFINREFEIDKRTRLLQAKLETDICSAG